MNHEPFDVVGIKVPDISDNLEKVISDLNPTQKVGIRIWYKTLVEYPENGLEIMEMIDNRIREYRNNNKNG